MICIIVYILFSISYGFFELESVKESALQKVSGELRQSVSETEIKILNFKQFPGAELSPAEDTCGLQVRYLGTVRYTYFGNTPQILLADTLFKNLDPTFSKRCVFDNFFDLAVSTLIHEAFHVLDGLKEVVSGHPILPTLSLRSSLRDGTKDGFINLGLRKDFFSSKNLTPLNQFLGGSLAKNNAEYSARFIELTAMEAEDPCARPTLKYLWRNYFGSRLQLESCEFKISVGANKLSLSDIQYIQMSSIGEVLIQTNQDKRYIFKLTANQKTQKYLGQLVEENNLKESKFYKVQDELLIFLWLLEQNELIYFYQSPQVEKAIRSFVNWAIVKT